VAELDEDTVEDLLAAADRAFAVFRFEAVRGLGVALVRGRRVAVVAVGGSGFFVG
jgi:hypothetical protein